MTKDSVLAILRKEETYISGERISQLLGVSRAAVNSAVKTLRAEGYDILSSTRKGYCLNAVPNALTENELAAYLPTQRMRSVLYVESVDSTNDRLREMALAGAADGQVVIANEQLHGRGRRGRKFATAKDKGIYLSALFRPESLPSDIAEITAWTAVAVSNAIETVCGLRPGIKWVNDLLLNGRKVCGILTEMSVESESGYVQYVIIGIGVNVNQRETDFPEELRGIASSLSVEAEREISRAQLAAQIVKELDLLQQAWPDEKQKFLERYRKDSVMTGKEITVVRGSTERKGVALSISEDFSLNVRYEDGTVEAVSSGEVSIRGLYGAR